jgi:hypothetical protein
MVTPTGAGSAVYLAPTILNMAVEKYVRALGYAPQRGAGGENPHG